LGRVDSLVDGGRVPGVRRRVRVLSRCEAKQDRQEQGEHQAEAFGPDWARVRGHLTAATGRPLDG
jgi:hypothetical protein